MFKPPVISDCSKAEVPFWFSVACFWLFVILVISRFGFEGWIWALIASSPDVCIFFTFIDPSELCGKYASGLKRY